MSFFVKPSIAALALFMSLSHAQAQINETAAPPKATEPGIVVKVEQAIERGARAAASGVERGVRAAASGVERGVNAAASGVERGAKAATGAASHVAGKITGQPASSPASSTK